MRIFSARTAAKNFGAVLDAADKAPVTINRHGRPRAVMIGWREFQHYRKAYDEAMEQRLIEILEQGAVNLIEGKLGRGQKALALVRRLRRSAAEADFANAEADADAYTEKEDRAPQS